MIVFELLCHSGSHRFEGWFGSSGDFDTQREAGLLSCPQCGSNHVTKAPMAPSVGRKGNQQQLAKQSPNPQPVAGGAIPPEAQKMFKALAAMQAEALKNSRWVGEGFAEESRAMHYGERDEEVIHGQATPQEAQELIDEGIAVMPLPLPVAPPDKLN